MNRFLYLNFLSIFMITLSFKSYAWEQEVKYEGALRNVMMKGDLSPKINLKTLKNLKNLYALGATAYLKGEIQIFNSQPESTNVDKNSQIEFERTYHIDASLIVYAQVPQWSKYKIPKQVISKKQFEIYLEKKAKQHGLDVNKAFPFLLEGKLKSNSWHVINWDLSDKIHTHQKHIESGINATTKDMSVTMLGFFSKNHTGIFTHHTTNMHIHFISKDKKIAGHSDNMILGDKMILKLPKM